MELLFVCLFTFQKLNGPFFCEHSNIEENDVLEVAAYLKMASLGNEDGLDILSHICLKDHTESMARQRLRIRIKLLEKPSEKVRRKIKIKMVP